MEYSQINITIMSSNHAMADFKSFINALVRIDEQIPKMLDGEQYADTIIGLQLGTLMSICTRKEVKNIVKEKGLDKLGWGHLAQ